MSLAGPNAPLSPVSVGGSEWSVGKYQGPDDGPYPNNRSNLASPPISGGSNDAMSLNGFPAPTRSNTGGPSPPPSVGARSSSGTNIYARSERNSTRGGDMDETVLGEHYRTLRTFLQSRDPNAKQQPNKARDKLLRLSSVQFFELSTDVFDELIRRQAAARAPPNIPNGPPAFLMPEKNFHPKRNQARQRLSSLGPPRFRDLAADVFHELERRFPRFAGGDIPRGGSAMSNRSGPGGPFPPRGPSAMRRPSDASSIRGPPPFDAYGIPPSPGMPPGEFGRPMQKQLNQNNTIVPNKSTMVEEDDDGADDDGSDAYGDRESKRSAGSGAASETDKKLIEDYQSQLRELRDKLDGMEDALKKKDDEMNAALENERSRAANVDTDRQEWDQLRRSLEDKLSEAQSLNDSMKQELDRMRDDHDDETRRLRDQVQQMQINAANVNASSRNANPELERENEELRNSLREQQRVTEEVRREAQDFLQEMRALSQQSTSTYERQLELEKSVQELEREVREWRNRYARTKTQLRDLRGSSFDSPAMDQNAAKYLRETGFVEDTGLVKDVHVTKFQIAIDELLRTARSEDSRKVMEAMKLVVVSVRRITKDLDEATPQDDEFGQRQGKLRAKVSATANGLITASKNFAAGAGMFPVSVLDAAASHLSASIIEVLRLAKIRITPASELEQDEDDEVMSPVGSANGFYSPVKHSNGSSISSEALPPPPPFQGLGGFRASADSSAYSPVNSPRESLEPKPLGINGAMNGMTNGNGYNNYPPANGYGIQARDTQAEDLRIYVSDQSALIVSDIQNLVGLIRGDAGIDKITQQIASIDGIALNIIGETQRCANPNMVVRLDDCRQRLLESSDRGRQMASSGISPDDREWRMWSQTLPPIAFEINREIKELSQRLDRLASPTAADDFS